MSIGATSGSLGTITVGGLQFTPNSTDSSYCIDFSVINDWSSTSGDWMPMYFTRTGLGPDEVNGLHIWVRQPQSLTELIEDFMVYSYVDKTSGVVVDCLLLDTAPIITLQADDTFMIVLPANTSWNPDALQSADAPILFPELNPVQEAIADIQAANWRSSDPLNGIKAVLIPIQDFLNIVQNPNVLNISGVRAYFAIPDPLSPIGPDNFHLYLVPVVEQVNGELISYNDVLTDPVTNECLIYDTTMPCPHICSSPNPLNMMLGQKKHHSLLKTNEEGK